MAPKIEFVLAATVLALVLTALGHALATGALADRAGDGWRTTLVWSPSGGLAALLATCLALRWHARALARSRRWSAGGLTLRTLLLAYVLLPATVAGWLLFTGLLDQWFAAQAMPMRELLDWVGAIVVASSLAAVVFGAIPAFVCGYFLCRRYLRRQRSITGLA